MVSKKEMLLEGCNTKKIDINNGNYEYSDDSESKENSSIQNDKNKIICDDVTKNKFNNNNKYDNNKYNNNKKINNNQKNRKKNVLLFNKMDYSDSLSESSEGYEETKRKNKKNNKILKNNGKKTKRNNLLLSNEISNVEDSFIFVNLDKKSTEKINVNDKQIYGHVELVDKSVVNSIDDIDSWILV